MWGTGQSLLGPMIALASQEKEKRTRKGTYLVYSIEVKVG
jgi:hypothetical protein